MDTKHKTMAHQLLPLVKSFASGEQQLVAMQLGAKALTEDIMALLSGATPDDIEYARSAISAILLAGARGQQAFAGQPLSGAIWCKGPSELDISH